MPSGGHESKEVIGNTVNIAKQDGLQKRFHTNGLEVGQCFFHVFTCRREFDAYPVFQDPDDLAINLNGFASAGGGKHQLDVLSNGEGLRSLDKHSPDTDVPNGLCEDTPGCQRDLDRTGLPQMLPSVASCRLFQRAEKSSSVLFGCTVDEERNIVQQFFQSSLDTRRVGWFGGICHGITHYTQNAEKSNYYPH